MNSEDCFAYLVIDTKNPKGDYWAAFTHGVRAICVNNENCKKASCNYTHIPRDRIFTIGSAVKICQYCTFGKCNLKPSAPGFYHLPQGWIVDKCISVASLPEFGIPIPQFIRTIKTTQANLDLQKDLSAKQPEPPKKIKWANTIEKPVPFLKNAPPTNIAIAVHTDSQRKLILENLDRLKARASNAISADDMLIVLQDQINSAQEIIRQFV